MWECTSWRKMSPRPENTLCCNSTTRKSTSPPTTSIRCQSSKTSSRRRKTKASITRSITLCWVRISSFKLHIALSPWMPTSRKDSARRKISPKCSKTLISTLKSDCSLMKSWRSQWGVQLPVDSPWITEKWKISSMKKSKAASWV